MHGSSQCIHIGITITDASKQNVEQPDKERYSTEGCKFSKLLQFSFVLNFVHVCSFPSLFLNFLRPSDVCVLEVYCNRGTSSCFHDAPRQMKFLTFHRRITSVLFSTSPRSLFLSHSLSLPLSLSLSHTHTHTHTHTRTYTHTHTHTHTRTRLEPQGTNQWQQFC